MSWPAFGAGPLAHLDLTTERGIWGKMHAMPTDYRWIARTPGFPPADDAIELLLVVGPESAPAAASLWRSQDRRFLAAGTYPSPARDAAGRTGFLEKQIFVVERRAEVPAALAAFALLPAVRRRTSADWWDRRQDPRWSERDFHLPLEVEPGSITAVELKERIAVGLAQLAAMDPENLRKMYAAVLSSRKPAYLESMSGPLSAEATAALLLPLPRARADALSIAGWSLSTRYRRQRREAPWDIVVLDRVVRDDPDAGPASMPFSPETMSRAEEIVEAIREGKPERPGGAVAHLIVTVPAQPAQLAAGEASSPEMTPAGRPTPAEGELSSVEAPPVCRLGSHREVASSTGGPEQPRDLPSQVDADSDRGGEILENTTEPPVSSLGSEWQNLCQDIESGLHFEDLHEHQSLLNALPEVVRGWLQYICSPQGFKLPGEIDLPRRWAVMGRGAPGLSVLRSALRAVEGPLTRKNPKVDLVRAALLVLDGSLGSVDTLKLYNAVSSAAVEPLEFIERIDSDAGADLQRRLNEARRRAPPASM